MSETYIPSSTCPKCGAALASAATRGLCPRCLLAEAMVPTQDEPTGPHGTKIIPPPKSLTPAELAPHFPKLEILECLGRGGMGVVYKARQISLNRLVALKLLAPERVADAKFAQRFTHEAQALAKLNHPNIVTIYDFGQAGGYYFLLMEFVDGVNLRQAMKAGRFTPEQALAIVPPVCEALQYAHNHGIVHRDIKPENLLLDKEGRVMIADFGIAKILGAENNTGEPSVNPESAGGTPVPQSISAGTPQYMAPEQQTAPQQVDSRADIYSLGVVLYEMLTGELPGKPLEPPSRKVQIDVRLDAIVLRALEKKPELRYQQVSDVKTMCETIAATPNPEPAPAIKPDAPRAATTTVSTYYHHPKNFRDRWSWDATYIWWITALLAPLPGILAACLVSSLGAKAFFFLLLELIPLLNAFICFAVLRRVDRLRDNMPTDALEMAEGLYATRTSQSPCLAVLAADRLELRCVAGNPVTIPLSDIESVTEIRWLSGRRLWWKRGLKIERRSAPPVMLALAESVFQRWRPLFSGAVQKLEPLPVGTGGAPVIPPPKTFWQMLQFRFWPPMVVRCNGQRVINWPAVAMRVIRGLLLLVPTAAIFILGGINSHESGRLAWFGVAWLVLGMLFLSAVLAIRVLRGFSRPLNELPELDNPVNTPPGSSGRESAQTEKSEIISRFSRTAIAGAAWLTLFFAVVPAFLWHEVKTHEFENHGPFASPLMVFVFFVFIFPAFIAPFGTTILGWISVTQIRRSAGKLHGLGLAVFDGLLFPLLALDGVFVWVVRRLVQIFVEFYSNFSNLNKLEVHPSFTTQLANLFSQHSELVAFIAVSIIIVVDFLIIRAVWRAVNRGSPSPLADQAAINEAEWRDPRNWSAGIYFSKRDSRTHVPKRIPALGWTVNLGRWQGVLLLFGVILLVVAALVVGLQQVISQQKPAVIQQTTATETSGFGPVIERELSANATLTNAFLNLDTGKVLSAPKEFLDSLRAKGRLNNGSPQAYAVREWMSSSGADVIALVGFGKPSRLVQVDGVSVSVGEKPPQPGGYTFDTVTAALLMKTITLPSLDDSEKQWFYFPSIISSFKTREGRIGVLEILDAKPDKVKLRYKLVLGGATNAAAFWQTPRVRLEQQLLRAMEQNLSATATGASPERGEFIDYELLGVDVAKDLRTAKIDLAGVKPRWSSPHKELWKRVPKGEFGASDEGSGMWIVTGKGDLGALQFKVQVTNLVEQAQPAAVFGLQAERMIAATDANPDGVVAFRFENNFPFQPPVAVTGHFKDPAKIGFTPELRRWMQDENADLLFYFDKKAYYVLSFNMRTGWAGQPKEWDTILPDCAVPQLTKMEKLNSEPAGPSIMGGCGYRDGLGEVSVFRTRGGLVGFYQLRGLADADGRGVNIRYKLVLGGSTNATFAVSPDTTQSAPVPVPVVVRSIPALVPIGGILLLLVGGIAVIVLAVRKSKLGAGRTMAIGCGVIMLGFVLVLLLVAVSFMGKTFQAAATRWSVQHARLQSALSTPPIASGLAFGPVMERVVPFSAPCVGHAFQFRSGQLFVDGHGPGTTKEQADEDWKIMEAAGGVDATANGNENGLQFAGEGCLFLKAVVPQWQEATAANVVDNLKDTTWIVGILQPTRKDLPLTAYFKTARGEMGILQLLDIVESDLGYHSEGKKGYGVKLRYKLVQGGATKAPIALDQLQGTWQGFEAGREGLCKLTVAENNVQFQGVVKQEWYRAKFELISGTGPLQIRSVITECPEPRYVGKVCFAILAIDNDRLTFVANEPGDPTVPKGFEGDDHSRHFAFAKVKTVTKPALAATNAPATQLIQPGTPKP